MGDVVNLRQARKQKTREEENHEAAENRARYGRTKAEKAQDAAESARNRNEHDGKKIPD